MTDTRTDRQTDRQIEFSSLYRVCITCSAVIKLIEFNFLKDAADWFVLALSNVSTSKALN